MAIFRKKSQETIDCETACGMPTAKSTHERVADFSYQNDSLAELVVKAWTDNGFRDFLLTRKEDDGTSPNAKKELAERGIYLEDPVVITEEHYFHGYRIETPDSNRVVFVLPNFDRVEAKADGHGLLETARLLMACTPNGI